MIDKRIEALRLLMAEYKIDAYIIPGSDEHQNEYLPDMWKRREWISGFTGSAGAVAVTMDKAGLWTDSRYFLQAGEELKGSRLQLFKLGVSGTSDIWEWVKYELKPGMCAGIDPAVITALAANNARQLLKSRELKLKYIENNLVDMIWEHRPDFPLNPAVPHPLVYSGETISGKLERIREELKKENCCGLILSRLDSIAWLFNIRGNDIPYNPLVIAYAFITESEAKLFIKPEKVTEELKKHFTGTVQLYPYIDFKSHLQEYHGLRQQALQKELVQSEARGEKLWEKRIRDKKIWIDERNTSAWVVSLLDKKRIYFDDCPVYSLKAVKNKTEIQNFKNAHLRDGVAMVKFLKWLDENIQSGKITEAGAAAQLENFRAAGALYKEASFPAISAYNEHGAIVHYTHSEKSNAVLRNSGLYLIDSGAHYLDGTTDITRTVVCGEPTDEQKEHFTRVLQGHIDLALTSFPDGTHGSQLDTIARRPLWDIGLDYGHGTGHGIGAYLNVHEGPHSISQSRGIMVKLKEGMFCSNEPGYYKTGEYGIRIENIVYIVKDEDKTKGDNLFYHFENVTLCPIDIRLIKCSLLTGRQVSYLNNYHMTVKEKLNPLLNEEEREWLAKAAALI